jgi:hypothetical protein
MDLILPARRRRKTARKQVGCGLFQYVNKALKLTQAKVYTREHFAPPAAGPGRFDPPGGG